jgi:hypothetical protein
MLKSAAMLPKSLTRPSILHKYGMRTSILLGEKLKNILEPYLQEMTPFDEEKCTESDIDNYAEQLSTPSQKALKETIPRKRPSPHSKSWWTEKLSIEKHIQTNKACN